MSDKNEISIGELAAAVGRAKYGVAAFAVLCMALGATFGLVAGRTYQATTLLAPVLEENSGGSLGGLGAIASQYSGLASLAGVNIAGGGKREEAAAVLQSELLTERYIKDSNLLPILYANRWDARTQKWRVDSPDRVPTLWQANRMFQKQIRQVSTDAKTGLIILTIKWKDPIMAARWANDLVKLTNSYLRDKAIAESERNIKYLNDQAAQASGVETRRTIYTLQEQEINKEMLARGRDEYAIKTIDPAFVPEKPSSLGPAALGLLGLIFGLIGGVVFLFAKRIAVV